MGTLKVGEMGCDYSFARPTTDELIRAGFTYVARYLYPGYSTGKTLLKSERDRLLEKGFGIIALFEKSADRPNSGGPGGRTDGLIAVKSAIDIGLPRSLPIYACVDLDTWTANKAQHVAYLNAFRAVVVESQYQLGIYGDTDIFNAMGDKSVSNIKANARAWSPNPSFYVNIIQGPTDPSGRWDTLKTLTPVKIWSKESHMPGYMPSPFTPGAVLLRFDGTQNLFLIDSANALHVTPELRAHYVDTLKIPVMVVPQHAQAMKGIFEKAGLTLNDMIPQK